MPAPDDSFTLRDYLIALQEGKIEEFEEQVLEMLEPCVDSSYDGWGDVALKAWYESMLQHTVLALGGPEVVLGMLGVPVVFPDTWSRDDSSEN